MRHSALLNHSCNWLSCSAFCGWQLKLEGVYHHCLSAKIDVTWDPEVFAGLTIKVTAVASWPGFSLL
jgi:hypothetical protein